MSISGEEFLNKLYKDLNLSNEVKKTANGSKDKNEAVARYMERLEKVHDKALKREHSLELLKSLYHKKYVVKENDIPQYRDKEKIIKKQKESLDKWLDYLLDENANYPIWAKYWVFQGMLKIGTYNETTGSYQKRSKKTLSPFIEINPEVLARCIELAIDYTEQGEINDNELKKLIESGSFSKLYSFLLKKQNKDKIIQSNIYEGIWKVYHYETEEEANKKEKQGIEPEYLKLYNSLQGYNTKWCTAGSKLTAKEQICGSNQHWFMMGGDFYVYYTKDNNGEYKIPRIAIRMNHKFIGEIKGIAEYQNIEVGLEKIVEQKISEFDDLRIYDKQSALEIIEDIKYVALLNKKNNENESFTEDDIKFIYQINGKIKRFGYRDDPIIETIISKRDKEKDANCLTSEFDKAIFWGNYISDIPKKLLADKKFIKNFLKMNFFMFEKFMESVSDEIKNDKEFMFSLIKEDVTALNSVPEQIKNNRDFLLELIKIYSFYDFADFLSREVIRNLKKDKDFSLLAVKKDARYVKLIDNSLKEDEDFMSKINNIIYEEQSGIKSIKR